MKQKSMIQYKDLVTVSVGGISVIIKDIPDSDEIEITVWDTKHNVLLSSETFYDPYYEPLDPQP